MRHIGILVATLVITVAALSVGTVLATPGSGFSATVLAVATFDPFHIQTPDLKIHSKNRANVIVQEATFLEGGHTGWHSHPGAPLVLVKEGHIAFTRADGCTTEVFGPGEGFVEVPGEVLIARNVGGPGEKAVAIVIFLANPIGVPARTDENDPGC
jgi:quercetin dioxygenase-like cupin family protein